MHNTAMRDAFERVQIKGEPTPLARMIINQMDKGAGIARDPRPSRRPPRREGAVPKVRQQ